MNRSFTLFFIVLLCTSSVLNAQDTHFSQFYASPLNLNPALTGISDGAYRVAGIYRNQDRSFTTPYITYSGSFDIKLLQNLLKNDVFGVGGLFVGDKSGDGVLTMNTGMLSLSYHKSLGKEHNHFIGIGLQGGYVQKSVDIARLTFPDQHVSGNFDLSQPNHENLSKSKVSYFDLNVGILHQSWIKPGEVGIFTGLSIYHLTSPKESFYNDNVRLSNRLPLTQGLMSK